MEPIKNIPLELGYVLIAFAGGVARYLNGYASGTPFKLGVFAASAIVSGFSGYMFALLGIAMYMPFPFIFMMAGTGGFFGEQTLRYLMDVITKRVSK